MSLNYSENGHQTYSMNNSGKHQVPTIGCILVVVSTTDLLVIMVQQCGQMVIQDKCKVMVMKTHHFQLILTFPKAITWTMYTASNVLEWAISPIHAGVPNSITDSIFSASVERQLRPSLRI